MHSIKIKEPLFFWFDLFLIAMAEIQFRWVFWSIWRHQKDFSKLTDLYFLEGRVRPQSKYLYWGYYKKYGICGNMVVLEKRFWYHVWNIKFSKSSWPHKWAIDFLAPMVSYLYLHSTEDDEKNWFSAARFSLELKKLN